MKQPHYLTMTVNITESEHVAQEDAAKKAGIQWERWAINALNMAAKERAFAPNTEPKEPEAEHSSSMPQRRCG